MAQVACELAAECPQTRIVSIADREADIYFRTQKNGSLSMRRTKLIFDNSVKSD